MEACGIAGETGERGEDVQLNPWLGKPTHRFSGTLLAKLPAHQVNSLLAMRTKRLTKFCRSWKKGSSFRAAGPFNAGHLRFSIIQKLTKFPNIDIAVHHLSTGCMNLNGEAIGFLRVPENISLQSRGEPIHNRLAVERYQWRQL